MKKTDINEVNFLKLVELFKCAKVSGQKEVLSEILFEKYLPAKAQDLFDLFSNDDFSKIRLLAVKIGKEYSFNIEMFKSDIDGHIRKEAKK